MLNSLLNGSVAISQKAINSLEQGGGFAAMGAALAGYISTNHELVWFTFGVIGASCSIYGVYLNHKKTMLAEEMASIEKKIKLKQVEGDNDDPPVSPI